MRKIIEADIRIDSGGDVSFRPTGLEDWIFPNIHMEVEKDEKDNMYVVIAHDGEEWSPNFKLKIEGTMVTFTVDAISSEIQEFEITHIGNRH